jgi:hypothetical protein
MRFESAIVLFMPLIGSECIAGLYDHPFRPFNIEILNQNATKNF